MTTFSGWWKTFNAKKRIHSHYYVCGDERVLVDDVLESIQTHYPVESWNLSKFVAGVHAEAEIWESLFSASIDGGDSITVVTNAEKLTNMHLLPQLVRDKSPKHVVVFISGESKVERTSEQQEDGSKKMVLPAHFENFEKKGRIIECIPFTQATSKTAVAWIQTKVVAKDNALVHLLNESNGDLRVVRDVIRKLQWLQEPATVRNVNVFLESEPSDAFSDALLAMDKSTAITALVKIPTSEYLQLVGHLDAQVDLAGRVHDMLAQRKSIPEIMRAVGGQAFLVPAISKVARHYTRERRLGMRKLLAETDRRLRRGYSEGIIESLVALW